MIIQIDDRLFILLILLIFIYNTIMIIEYFNNIGKNRI